MNKQGVWQAVAISWDSLSSTIDEFRDFIPVVPNNLFEPLPNQGSDCFLLVTTLNILQWSLITQNKIMVLIPRSPQRLAYFPRGVIYPRNGNQCFMQ